MLKAGSGGWVLRVMRGAGPPPGRARSAEGMVAWVAGTGGMKAGAAKL
jgi:hypothetical protein